MWKIIDVILRLGVIAVTLAMFPQPVLCVYFTALKKEKNSFVLYGNVYISMFRKFQAFCNVKLQLIFYKTAHFFGFIYLYIYYSF
jgi:hypothetical protein